MMPLMFAGATAVLMFGLMKVLKKQGVSSDPSPPPVSATTSTTEKPAAPDETPEISGRTTIASTTETSGKPKETPEPPLLAEASMRPSAATEALTVLEGFLKASSLQERMPIIETKEAEGDLTDSILATSLPSYRNLVIDSQESFPLENIIDFYFTFEFVNQDGSADPQTVVVRRRGGLNPRVLAILSSIFMVDAWPLMPRNHIPKASCSM
jgi:hypothetical protein